MVSKLAFITILALTSASSIYAQHISNPGSPLGAGPWQPRQIVNPQESRNRDIIDAKLSQFDSDIFQKSNSLQMAIYQAAELTNQLASLENHPQEVALPDPPDDPWRIVNDETVFITDKRFKHCGGTILETVGNGILVRDFFGDNCFVKNYPNKFTDGSVVNILGIPIDAYSYNNVLGGVRTVKSFDYGTPCAPPADAEAIKAKAIRDEEREIKDGLAGAQSEISRTQDDYQSAVKQREDYIQKFNAILEDQRQAAQAKKDEKNKAMQAKVLASNQAQAAAGDAYGLLRMGERYRDGDGVEKDLDKARDYLQRAANAGSLTASNELSNLH